MVARTIAMTTLTKLAAEKCRTSSNVEEFRAVLFSNASMLFLCFAAPIRPGIDSVFHGIDSIAAIKFYAGNVK
jgi:hypothetical protein